MHDIFDAGATLIEDFVSESEAHGFTTVIERSAWSRALRRRVQHYGYRYDYGRTTAPEPCTPLPAWAQLLAERLRAHFGATTPEQCIVNAYRCGEGIGMHADHRAFGPVVASITLRGAWPMRFRRHSAGPYRRAGQAGDQVVVLPERSALILQGAARSAWMHGIDPADTRSAATERLSATFRTLAA